MTPDFSKPAFAFAALCSARFFSPDEGGHPGPFRSDYRCQVRYGDAGNPPDADARVYFVGRETAKGGEEVSIVLAFVDQERARAECRVAGVIELCEGSSVIATCVVHAIATR